MTNVLGWILLVVLLFLAFYVLLNIIKVLLMFYARRCKYCGHIMVYKSRHLENEGTSYIFHCEHCGAWERVSKEDMFRNDGENNVTLA